MSNDRIVRRLTPRLSLLLSTFTIVFAWIAWTLFAKKSSSTLRKFSSSEEDETTNGSEEESIEQDFLANSRHDDLEKNGDAIHYDGGTIDEDRSTVARCYGLLNDIDSRIGRIFLRVFGRQNSIRRNRTIDDDDDDGGAAIVDGDE